GHDVTGYALACFGGAGGQHACRVADALGMETVLIHPLAGMLSAYGIGLFAVHSFLGHNGGIEGYTSVMMHSLEKDATIIILYNCKLHAHRPDDLFLEFLHVLYPGEY
ncbi:MAG: hydantoinase/oxoprolinase family protein, partial [Desulfomonilia bacterium]|nr:hydantoinase/oxoprolinase family protein [Desulfomonilia bacterium]